jgi:putative flippase GtrA
VGLRWVAVGRYAGLACFVIVTRPTYAWAVPSPSPLTRLRAGIRERVGHLVHEIAKFGVVGGIAYAVDVGSFSLMRHHWLSDKPITAKVISTVLATAIAYLGNRFWTFRHRDRVGYAREYAMFFVLNIGGLAIAVGCLWVSHYLLGLRTLLADNISANGVGLVLGTLFRFWAYRKWVFPEIPDENAITAGSHQPV